MGEPGGEDLERPAYDARAELLSEMFSVIQRARTFTDMGFPMKLSVKDINDYEAAHGLPLPRVVVDAAIFAADDIFVNAMTEGMRT